MIIAALAGLVLVAIATAWLMAAVLLLAARVAFGLLGAFTPRR